MLRTAEQVAQIFSVTPSTARRWATKTQHHAPCPHTKDGRGRLRFDVDEVDEWLRQTGVLKRSQAQVRYTPSPPVNITAAIRWEPEQVTTDTDDRELVALHRTVVTCLHVCRTHTQLPDPPDNLDREHHLVWLLRLDHRPAEIWKQIAREAIDTAGENALLDAIHG